MFRTGLNIEHPWMSQSVDQLAEDQEVAHTSTYLSTIQSELLQQIVDGRLTEIDEQAGAQLIIINKNQITSMSQAAQFQIIAAHMRCGRVRIIPQQERLDAAEKQNYDQALGEETEEESAVADEEELAPAAADPYDTGEATEEFISPEAYDALDVSAPSARRQARR